jgi:hypothetical protein
MIINEYDALSHPITSMMSKWILTDPRAVDNLVVIRGVVDPPAAPRKGGREG